MKTFARHWKWLLLFSFFCGLTLRLLYPEDMEYKEDEEYNFIQTQLAGDMTSWPWVGMPSGVYWRNPGMSVWVFIALAKIFGITTPTGLATAVRLFAMLGVGLIIPFAFRFIRDREEREPWLWAFVFACVNPFLILYQRKLWPQPFLPAFTMATLMGWWRRHTAWGAFFWGLIGAWLGQIHMAGFFFALALVLWTLFFGRRQVHWKGWFFGSVLGALPLIPWFLHILSAPLQGQASASLSQMLQLKFWVFWITDPTGLTLGNPLGLLRGQSQIAQISDFIRYPIIAGQPTFLIGAAHLLALLVSISVLAKGIGRGLKKVHGGLPELIDTSVGRGSQTAFVQNSSLWGFGVLLTLTGVNIRRYYMCITFPLEYVWLSRMALSGPESLRNKWRAALGALWLAQLTISAGFVGYVHVHEGATQGDYGPAYHIHMKERKRTGVAPDMPSLLPEHRERTGRGPK
ncbi:MAG: hypothetical protein A2X94_07085 [Bdellovibrionales bacterium GWB1_55_8]|nr:MAG: hypothetical protein A2X94_07085 [Bdellovibrionales bacterium GWB1_55_8]